MSAETNYSKQFGDKLLKACVDYRAQVDQLERQNTELLTVLQILARHSCHTGKAERDYNGQVAGTEVTDSGAIAANAMALCRLAEADLFRIVAESGRMIVGYWPDNDPQKKEKP